MDFSKIDDIFSREIVRGGEAYLDGQLRIATSADQRSASLAGVFTAAATALLAATVALANPAWNIPGHVALMIGATVSALMFFVGAVLCWLVLMPVKFWIPGCEPHLWESDVTAGKKLHDCLGERADHVEEQIADNLQVIERNANKFRVGAIVGILAPPVGFISWLLASVCHFVS
jgi:hypothetical protein